MFPFIRIGDFYLPTYGLLVTFAFLAGVWMVGRLARRSGINAESAMNLAIYAALAGIAGSKALMIAFDFKYYLANPLSLFSFSTLQAGGIFFGGLVAALFAGWLYLRHARLPVLGTADVLAPAIALGHGFGRLGCFAAGCCWGAASGEPWAVTFTHPEAHRLFGTPLNVPLHPSQLYEAFAEFAIFGILYRQFRKPHGPGAIVGLYLVLYPAARFIVEFVRAHDEANPYYGPFVAEQWIALALIATGGYVVARSRRAQAAPAAASTPIANEIAAAPARRAKDNSPRRKPWES